jgi:DNA polymerase I
MTIPRVFLVDASIYIFRAWHIFESTITTRDGQPANAVFGFGDFLFQLLKQTKAEHVACAFDASQKQSFRKEIYPAYKANRTPAPEDLKVQFALCREFCRAVGIAEFASDRYEADDIIGTLAHHYRQQGFAITVVSADKDLTQLVLGEHDRWWDFARGTLLDQHGIRKQFGVYPAQIADMLALSGDKIDNIPGVPGVGYTTAAKLLQKYPSVESILEHHHKIGEMKFRGAIRIQALIAAHQAILPRNKQLTTVATDMSFNTPPELSWRGVDSTLFADCCEKLALTGQLQQRWLQLTSE